MAKERWQKTQGCIKRLQQLAKENILRMPRVELESIRSFLVYTTRTYWDMVPYLKGLHLTIDEWRPNRGHDGWKLVGVRLEEAMNKIHTGEETLTGPMIVKGVERLSRDLEALAALTACEEPPLRTVRVNKVALALYLPGVLVIKVLAQL